MLDNNTVNLIDTNNEADKRFQADLDFIREHLEKDPKAATSLNKSLNKLIETQDLLRNLDQWILINASKTLSEQKINQFNNQLRLLDNSYDSFKRSLISFPENTAAALIGLASGIVLAIVFATVLGILTVPLAFGLPIAISVAISLDLIIGIMVGVFGAECVRDAANDHFISRNEFFRNSREDIESKVHEFSQVRFNPSFFMTTPKTTDAPQKDADALVLN